MVSESIPTCPLQDHIPSQLRRNKEAEASLPIPPGYCLKRDVLCHGRAREATVAAKDQFRGGQRAIYRRPAILLLNNQLHLLRQGLRPIHSDQPMVPKDAVCLRSEVDPRRLADGGSLGDKDAQQRKGDRE